MQKDKLIKMLIGFLPLLLLFLDPPEGMDPKAWGLFPFYAGAILMVMLRPVGEALPLSAGPPLLIRKSTPLPWFWASSPSA